MNGHARIDARSLAFGHAIAARIKDNPQFVERARLTLERWLKTCSPGTVSTLHEWRDTLNGPVSGVIDLLTGEDERAVRLRQSNPFTAVLPPDERNRIIEHFRSDGATGT